MPVVENTDYSTSDEEDTQAPLEPWVLIQQHTFKNWVNDKLSNVDLQVDDLRRDFKSGIALCRLMEVLKRKSIGRVITKVKVNHYEAAGNLELAFQAMKSDKVRLVNIGAEDITSGNNKLILGMMWTLIRRYQIGSKGNSSSKQLMLTWINAVLHPHKTVANFSTDWNNGVALHGVIEYCRPGSCPDWKSNTSLDNVTNCENAIALATELFNIPAVVRAEDVANRNLDELSMMTYMSYFMAPEAAGYQATLNWVRSQIHPTPVDNFDGDWNNGYILSALVHSLGGAVPGWPNVDTSAKSEQTLKTAMDVSKKTLLVDPVLSSRDMSKPEVDRIGIMAYAAWHEAKTARKAKPRMSAPPTEMSPPSPAPPPPTASPPPAIVISTPIHIEPETESEIETETETSRDSEKELDSNSSTPPSPPPLRVTYSPIPLKRRSPSPMASSHSADYDDELTPPPVPAKIFENLSIDSGPWLVRKMDNWKIDSTTTIRVNTERLGAGDLTAVAHAPSKTKQDLPVTQAEDEWEAHIDFTPTEKGPWTVYIYINGSEIKGNPYMFNVYDPAMARINRDYTTAAMGESFHFEVDCSNVGFGELDAYVIHDGRSVPCVVNENLANKYHVNFEPETKGNYSVAVYCGGAAIPGSPFDVVCKSIEMVAARGRGLDGGVVGTESAFQIDTQSLPGKVLETVIKSPSGNEVAFKVNYDTAGAANVTYLPREPGVHTIALLYDGVAVRGSPFRADVKPKVPRVHITGIVSPQKLGSRLKFKIDASEMKKGALEIDSDLQVHKYDKLGNNTYAVTINLKKRGSHELVVRYNSKVVEGGPFVIEVT